MMKQYWRNWVWIGLLSIGCSMWGMACSSDEGTVIDGRLGIPQLTVSLEENRPAENIVRIRLEVRNIGGHPLTVPSLQENMLETYMLWGGWSLGIRDQDGRVFHYLMTKRPPPLKKVTDFITLQSGESFAVSMNIADTHGFAGIVQNWDEPYPPLAQAPGTYEVLVGLFWDYETIHPKFVNLVWQGEEIESNHLHVTIHHPNTPALPKLLTYPPRGAGWRCQCRADCDPDVADNPCLLLPADEQSQLSDVVDAAELDDAAKHARVQAKTRLQGIPIPRQACFCTSPEGKPYGSYYDENWKHYWTE